jgi:putative FmdB family regulatory protein
MPTYQYECRDCSKQLETFQNASESPLKICPSCKKEGLFRIISGGLGFFLSNRTVGALADHHTSTFSADYKQHLNSQSEIKKADTLSKHLKGAKLQSKPKIDAKTIEAKKLDNKLKNASKEQIKTYIETGKI